MLVWASNKRFHQQNPVISHYKLGSPKCKVFLSKSPFFHIELIPNLIFYHICLIVSYFPTLHENISSRTGKMDQLATMELNYTFYIVGPHGGDRDFFSLSLSFKILLIFREREGGRKRRRKTFMWEKHWLVPLVHILTRNWTCSPSRCPDLELNWWPFTSRDDTQPTEAHQTRQGFFLDHNQG